MLGLEGRRRGAYTAPMQIVTIAQAHEDLFKILVSGFVPPTEKILKEALGMSLTPAHDQREVNKRRDEVEKCGKNMGPHDYIPIETMRINDNVGIEFVRVTKFLCRVCFYSIQTKDLLEHYHQFKGNR